MLAQAANVIPLHSQELSAIAAQLLSALDAYEQAADALVENWNDLLYSDCSELFDEARMYASTLPKIQALYIELLICRFELMEALWRERQHPEEIAEQSAKHKRALAELRQACWRHYKSGCVIQMAEKKSP
ncbi:hypothetical protein EZ313_20260 [Ramlibacter henchirensis]|uniref:Uncharacterized protein n=1 Tax=Ramlibacter henchirensis TaxID=204072 RepID=A0A4Z0BPM5_9BURK|nr:hypothetical protein [Ramlibacter henchirensis]TFZ00781.1 hypothetical protein EZ313_20260 [Ramlibacter henchirensis]